MKLRRSYGWRPDVPDHRDFRYSAPRLRRLPAKVDLRSKCPAVRDQGALGSCTGFSARGGFGFVAKQQGETFEPSPLFLYYNGRAAIDSIGTDSGAEIRDVIKSINDLGVCSEKSWPYRVSQFAKKPAAKAWAEALDHQSVEYRRVEQTLAELRGCLAAGLPIVFGISVYASFESAAVEKTGNVPLPKKREELLGGHAILMVGYDDRSKRFTFQNSWGTGWGAKGFGTLPYDYVTNPGMADDFWVLQVVE